jgi:CheY-like chemotaxis protein
VFSNLLNNAAKYSETEREINVTAELAGSKVRVRFDDQGAGLEPDSLPKIFQMFAQGGSIERSQAGLGVGLALAKRLVELHGGTIQAVSEGVGRGSSFTVTLPVMAALAHGATPESRPVQPAVRRRGTPLRILLVDDNVDFVTSLALLLESIGHEVRVAHAAEQALEIARALKPHFGFLDLGLPEVSGYTLARALHEQPETADTVLVAVSGWGQARDRERSRDAGFSLHLVKPVELNSIQAALSTLAGSR